MGPGDDEPIAGQFGNAGLVADLAGARVGVDLELAADLVARRIVNLRVNVVLAAVDIGPGDDITAGRQGGDRPWLVLVAGRAGRNHLHRAAGRQRLPDSEHRRIVGAYNDLSGNWPVSELSFGWKTHGWGIPEYGYTHYWKMFNYRQLLVHSLLMSSIRAAASDNPTLSELVLGSMQQYLRYNCYGTIWHHQNNQISAFFSNNNFPARNTTVEPGVFADTGDGTWVSACKGLMRGIEWRRQPWELATKDNLAAMLPPAIHSEISGRSAKVLCNDPPKAASITCVTSSALSHHQDQVR